MSLTIDRNHLLFLLKSKIQEATVRLAEIGAFNYFQY